MDTSELVAEIEQLPNTGRRRFSPGLRKRVQAAVFWLRDSGATKTSIADALKISQTTVARYLREPSSSSTSMRPVTVRRSSGSKVTTPSGFEVEGLEVEEIVTLIRSLS